MFFDGGGEEGRDVNPGGSVGKLVVIGGVGDVDGVVEGARGLGRGGPVVQFGVVADGINGVGKVEVGLVG